MRYEESYEEFSKGDYVVGNGTPGLHAYIEEDKAKLLEVVGRYKDTLLELRVVRHINPSFEGERFVAPDFLLREASEEEINVFTKGEER